MSVITNNPEYSVVIYERTLPTYGIGNRVLEINNPKNLGWADYLNDVPECFFTLFQEDPQAELLRTYAGKAHIRVYRIDPSTGERVVVWAGLFGTETNEEGEDAIFYSHGYLAILYWILTGWNITWTNATLQTIVDACWDSAKGVTESEVAFVTEGIIEAPATTSGGATPLTLPVYTAFYKPTLNILREMQAIGRSDTTNVVVFEITHSETPTFNFWKNKGSAKSVTYEYGGVDVEDFWYSRLEAHKRNHIAAVGTSPRDLTLRTEQSVSGGTTGRRSIPIYFQWVRDQTELERIAKLRLARTKRDHFRVGLIFYPGGCIPPGMSYSPWALADRINVKIDRGMTHVDESMIVVGVQVLYQHGEERVTLITETHTGS